MSRTGQQRLDAIAPAMKAKEEFIERVKAAEGDAIRLSDLMAEAINMNYEAAGLEVVGKDGRVTVCIERIVAAHCMLDAREAYLRARGSNSIVNK